MLRARALQVGHPGAPATPPLELAVGAGEWIAVSGPNGAGKTALLLTLAGLLEARSGEIVWEGAASVGEGAIGAADGAVGLALQNPEAQLLTDTVHHEIAFPLENLGWPRARIEARVQTLLRDFALAKLADRPLHSLSGGEQARLAVASAAAAEPALLLLDEPGASMDAGSRRRLVEWLQGWVAAGRAVVTATQLREEWHGAGRRLWLDPTGLCETEPAPVSARADSPPAAIPDALRWFTETGAESPGTDELSHYSRQSADPNEETSPVLLELDDVSHRFDRAGAGEWVLRGAHLRVRRGETIVLRGPSGSGKTTLLHLLAGLYAPTVGEVQVTPAFQALPERQRLGVLLQNPEDQLVGATVLADLCLGERRAGNAAQERAERALGETGLGAEFLARPPSSCSVGERRRVAWAGLLLLEAGVWLLDEPTAGIDEDGLRTLVRSIKQFNSRGGAVVVATQDERLTGILCTEGGLEGPCSVQVTPSRNRRF